MRKNYLGAEIPTFGELHNGTTLHISLKLDLQDDDRTLKVFLEDTKNIVSDYYGNALDKAVIETGNSLFGDCDNRKKEENS